MENKILLIDDEKIFLKSLKDGLQNLSYLFITEICYSVDQAIQLIKKNNYKLIITDVRMPKKTGIDLIIFLRDIDFQGEIIVMSAYNTEVNIQTIFILHIPIYELGTLEFENHKTFDFHHISE
jgi:YesN/AraC family two-component response regulator